jgi:hypothetical protein
MENKESRSPNIGEVFHHKYKGERYEMKVVKTDNGIGYELLGVIYKSPTAAAKAIVGADQFVSGRNFWHMDKR